MIYNGERGLSDLAETVDLVVEHMAPYIHEYSCIAVRGNSGVLVGSPVSLTLNKPLVVVRKPNEQHHGGSGIVNLVNIPDGTKGVFLDDFRSSGKTEAIVVRALAEGRSDAYADPTHRVKVTDCFYYRNASNTPGNPRSGWTSAKPWAGWEIPQDHMPFPLMNGKQW